MTLEEQCALSYYQEIGRLDEHKNVLLVQHSETKRVFVRKKLDVFDEDVFRYLKANPIPDTPRIYEAVRDGDRLIVIEEYISGPTLEEVLSERGVLTESETAACALQLCGILRRLHGARPPIIHRDIKPSNIIITPDGTLKLLDMNAARQDLGAKGSDTRLMGTAGYAAPEQYGFGSSDVRTDIHAVGALMNVMLTGELPTEKKAQGRLRPVIERCTQMDPDRRYRNIDELEKALRAAVRDLQDGQNGLPTPDAADDSVQRQRGAAAKAEQRLDNQAKTARADSPLWFLPPGLRSGKPGRMIAAACGYLFVCWAWFSIEIGNSPQDRLLIQSFFFAATLVVIFFSGNYLNVQRLFPLARSKNKFLKAVGVILWDFVLFMAIVMVLVIIEDVMGL